jgi:hypothetical protein
MLAQVPGEREQVEPEKAAGFCHQIKERAAD